MNTGIGDAFNLAHKLAQDYHDDNSECLREYDRERRYVGGLTRDLALENYEKSLMAARMLKLDKRNADAFTWAVESAGKYIPFFDPKAALKLGLDIGLNFAQF